jgi:hypothetical protein
MISSGDVPINNIAIFPNEIGFNVDRFKDVVVSLKKNKKRDWFPENVYRCLPVTIGSQYGFAVICEYDFSFVWDGSDSPEGVKFKFYDEPEVLKNKLPAISSHFGSGIITLNLPFHFRTSSGINIMTINPSNFIIPNVTVMTAVVETDNLRRDFSFNMKIQIPNIEVTVKAGTPLVGFIPIQRYFVDSFDLINSNMIFNQNEIDIEIEHNAEYKNNRKKISTTSSPYDRFYLNGKDASGNSFEDHQKEIGHTEEDRIVGYSTGKWSDDD